MDVSNLFDMYMMYVKYVHEIQIAPNALFTYFIF